MTMQGRFNSPSFSNAIGNTLQKNRKAILPSRFPTGKRPDYMPGAIHFAEPCERHQASPLWEAEDRCFPQISSLLESGPTTKRGLIVSASFSIGMVSNHTISV